ncbi:MAG: hypothetical protein M3176_15450 [Chloroflexota bacterium]|nr:hypothetical protein [Chloroflexota bacterium]
MSTLTRPDTRRHFHFAVLTDEKIAIAVFIAAFLLFAACIPRITTRLDPVTGDEPFYLMTAYSLLHDRDIDETNNFAARDWLRFYPSYPLAKDWQGWPGISPNLPPHGSKTYRAGLYSKHGLGIPALILAPFALRGRTGVVLLYNLMAAGVAANIYLLARTVAARHRALIVTALLMASVPLATYAFLIFPEMPAALMLVYAVRRLLAPTNTRWQWALVGLSVGYLPWLHARFIGVVAGLALIFAWRHLRTAWRPALFGIVPAVALLGLFEAYSLIFYHFPVPNRQDHAGFSTPIGTVNGFFGSLLDGQWGLFIVAPVYLLATAALVLYLRAHRRNGISLLCVLVPYAMTISAYLVWWGEWGPAARYWTAALPLLALPLAWWWETAARAHPRGAASLLGIVGAWGLFWTAGWLRQPQWLYNQPDGRNNLLMHWLGGFGKHLASLLPAYQFYAASPVGTRILWGVAVILLGVAAGSQMTLLMLPAGDAPPYEQEPSRAD